jgi:release factor glutamine methyltransferase
MSLTVGEGILKSAGYLAGLGMPAARLEAELLLAFVLGCERIKLYQNWDLPLNTAEVDAYRSVLRRRAQGEPMAYISGKKPFLSWDFAVTPAVLIPRPETEQLVETAITALDAKGREHSVLRCVDLGTGSGIIAIALAKLRPGLRVDACDISKEALVVARKNAEQLGVVEQVRFWQGNFLEAIPASELSEAFDLIVSNPPYIPANDIAGLSPEVRREPMLALAGGDDGLDAYRTILNQLPGRLRTGGDLIVEHGYDQAKALSELFSQHGFTEIQSFKDLAGLDRVIWGKGYQMK